MTPEAEQVRSVLRWSLDLLRDAESRGGRVALPGYATAPLNRMLARGDHLTAADIISSYCPSMQTPEGVAEYLSWIRRDRRPSTILRRTEVPGLPLAENMIARMRAYSRGEDRRLLEQGSVMTWKRLEDHWPGRVWFSLRDDYERLAERLYRAEKVFICQTSDFVVKVDRIRDCAHDRSGEEEASLRSVDARAGRPDP